MFVLLERFAAEEDKRQRSIKCKNLYLEAFCLKRRWVCLAGVWRAHIFMAAFVLSLRSDCFCPWKLVFTRAKAFRCHPLTELAFDTETFKWLLVIYFNLPPQQTSPLIRPAAEGHLQPFTCSSQPQHGTTDSSPPNVLNKPEMKH